MSEKINPYHHFFTTKDAMRKYGAAVENVGLWKSEEVLVGKYSGGKEGRVLDIGCGAGRTTFGLYRLGYRNILGIDVSQQLLGLAEAYGRNHGYRIPFLCVDAESMPFRNGEFSFALFSYNGLTGIPSEERRVAVLREVYRVLRPKGYFLFSAHNRDEDTASRTFWQHERERWEQGKHNPALYEYGDVLIPIADECAYEFLHYYSIDEMISFIGKTPFSLVDHISRREVAEETEAVSAFSAETVFWVLRKG